MKARYYILTAAFLFVQLLRVFSQDTLRYDNLKGMMSDIFGVYKQKYPSTTFFKYKTLSPAANFYDFYKGTSHDSSLTAIKYMEMVNNLDVSNFETDPKINLGYLQELLGRYMGESFTPFSISLVEYKDYKDSAIILGTAGLDGHKVTDNSPAGFYPFKNELLLAAAPLNEVYEIKELKFMFNDALFLTNVNSSRIGDCYIDFDDGNGFQLLVKDQVYSANYATYGSKVITLRMLVDGNTLQSQSIAESL